MNRKEKEPSFFSETLEKSFVNRTWAIFFGRMALYSTYFLLWLFSKAGGSFFPSTGFDLFLIVGAFSYALLAYHNRNHKLSRWSHFITLFLDVLIHLYFTRTTGYLLSPLMVAHPLFSAAFLLLFHNLLMLTCNLFMLPMAMALCLINDPQSSIAILLSLTILYLGLDIFVVLLINHSHGYEQKLALELLDAQKKLNELSIIKERQRISREFHDGAGANLTSIIMQCEYLERQGILSLLHIKEAAIESIDDMRRSIAFLNGSFDIVEQVELCLEKMRLRHQISTEHHNIEILRALSSDQQIATCRIIQEALTNVLKHAHASHVNISAQKSINTITITIKDDGIGFDQKASNGFGIKNMQERARQMKGLLTFTPVPKGSQIFLEIPNFTNTYAGKLVV
jgi:two-component system sensor histidine kinase DegS